MVLNLTRSLTMALRYPGRKVPWHGLKGLTQNCAQTLSPQQPERG